MCARTECLNPKGTLVDVADEGGSSEGVLLDSMGDEETTGDADESGDFKLNRADPSCDGGREVADAELGDRCGEGNAESGLKGAEKFGMVEAGLSCPGGVNTAARDDRGVGARLTGVELEPGPKCGERSSKT